RNGVTAAVSAASRARKRGAAEDGGHYNKFKNALYRRSDVRQQRHISCPLHRTGDHPLLHRVGPGALAREDLAVVADHLLQRLGVLVVDVGFPRRGVPGDLHLGPAEALKAVLAFPPLASPAA